MRRKKAIQISRLLGSQPPLFLLTRRGGTKVKWETDRLYQVQYVPSFEASKLLIFPVDLQLVPLAQEAGIVEAGECLP